MKKIVLILPLFILGCATITPEQLKTIQEHIFPASYENVFVATVKAITDLGCTIQTADKDTGVINTNYIEERASIVGGRSRRRWNVVVYRGDESATTVRAHFTKGEKGIWSDWYDEESKEATDYDMFFGLIQKHLFKKGG